MEKQVKRIKLELEMPQSCGKCPMAYETEGCYSDDCQLYYYLGNDEEFGGDIDNYFTEKDGVPSWCPLLKCEKMEYVKTDYKTDSYIGDGESVKREEV